MNHGSNLEKWAARTTGIHNEANDQDSSLETLLMNTLLCHSLSCAPYSGTCPHCADYHLIYAFEGDYQAPPKSCNLSQPARYHLCHVKYITCTQQHNCSVYNVNHAKTVMCSNGEASSLDDQIKVQPLPPLRVERLTASLSSSSFAPFTHSARASGTTLFSPTNVSKRLRHRD